MKPANQFLLDQMNRISLRQNAVLAAYESLAKHQPETNGRVIPDFNLARHAEQARRAKDENKS